MASYLQRPSARERNRETREEGAGPLSPLVLFQDTGVPPEIIHEHEALTAATHKLNLAGAKATDHDLTTASVRRVVLLASSTWQERKQQLLS